MSAGWAARRFWKTVRTEPAPGGFAVLLDARVVRTPAKAPLVLPTLRLAEAVAAEWEAQEGSIDPARMPATRAANAAIDKVSPLHEQVVGEVAGYGAADLLCYRAPAPPELRARQEAAWAPLVDWAAEALGAPLRVTEGVMHVAQPAASLEALRGQVAAHAPFELTALHEMVALSGSLVIGLAVSAGRAPAGRLWDISRIDELWQAEQWGADAEAEAQADARRRAFLDAERFLQLVRSDG